MSLMLQLLKKRPIKEYEFKTINFIASFLGRNNVYDEEMLE